MVFEFNIAITTEEVIKCCGGISFTPMILRINSPLICIWFLLRRCQHLTLNITYVISYTTSLKRKTLIFKLLNKSKKDLMFVVL